MSKVLLEICCGSADDVIEMLSAGASAVEIGTQNLIDPMCIVRIKQDLKTRLKELGVSTIQELTGRAYR